MYGQVQLARSLTAVWLASSQTKDGGGLTPRQLLDKLSGQDSDSHYFHRQLEPRVVAALDKVLKENEAREKAKQTMKNRLASIIHDDMSEQEESKRFEKMMKKISRMDEGSKKEADAAIKMKMLPNPLVEGKSVPEKNEEVKTNEKTIEKARVVQRGTGKKNNSPIRKGTGLKALPEPSEQSLEPKPGASSSKASKIFRGAGTKG